MSQNCTCENHGWCGDGHGSACAVSIIEALERECAKWEAAARERTENWRDACRKSDNQRLEIIKLKVEIAKLDPDNDLL